MNLELRLTEILKSLSPSEEELERIYGVLKIDDPDSIDIVEFQAIARVKNHWVHGRYKVYLNFSRVSLPEKVRRLELRRQNNSSLILKDATSSIDLEKFRGYNQCKRFLTATGLFWPIYLF